MKNIKKRVVVAMSGGVDSSVAAVLLKEQGYEVIGLTMCFNLAEKDGRKPSCCGLTGIEDARRVCQKLGIRHYVLNLNKDFYQEVIQNFYQEYLCGRTPNPCVRCNQFIKFGILLKKAINLGVQFLATGHYARIVKSPQGYLLKKAKDLKKDQSYFLYRLTQAQLKHVIFPLGNFTKPKVRQLASDFGLKVAEKQDSQEICFLPDGKYGDFIKAQGQGGVQPGKLIDRNGNILGAHQGIAFYTIGQRHGLGITTGYPLYVTQINARDNRVSVGRRQEVYKSEFIIKERHFLGKPPKKKIEIKVRIRYNHKEMPAVIYPAKDKLKVIFKHPQFAITPGQSAVFYDRDTVLGGGIIQKVIV
ncbi:MAG: tRNA 2-thiouridine(34) synthase MnmA [Candidatus Omnitrophica bacterium]|nr:tRNA 2-thiouridine(34) synthase MnmA [Candidatus Omnitrophota bacterium]MBU4303336.1 tRNA 2-thiouridine(34) synthase MnmA [Candidatus Omnitrophota bacterium]MBU4468347.1 tRNA 2-thiouridine(34) synthase MnmA [Candidatus Omnitrophota bacterium]MCG2708021.1 tRNA 2-thiouridine(34) synthase MnmA [Candidatus Omnitrophota bacterium]